MFLSLTGCSKKEELLGREAATEIALNDAGFPEKWVIQLKTTLDKEAGEHVYDVSFINATTKYFYIIDGDSGYIISKSTEPLFDETED